MKITLTLLGLALSASALANQDQYRFATVPYSEIDQYLVRGSDETGTPEALQGLWWLDGNPVPDKVISFASTRFTEIVKRGEVVGYEGYLPVYDEGIWSWDNSEKGLEAFETAYNNRLTYHLKFDPDFTHGDITLVVKPVPFLPRVEIPQTILASFTMDLVNNDEYVRTTALLGKSSTYRFRRVVDGQGNRLPAYEEYLKSLVTEGPETSILPICTESGDTLPTRCASL